MIPRPEQQQAVQLAIGRIFRLLSRPCKQGDALDYERCRALFGVRPDSEKAKRFIATPSGGCTQWRGRGKNGTENHNGLRPL